MKDAIIKRIEGYHHLRTIQWTILLVLAGGTANKISHLSSLVDVSLAIVGALLIIIILKEIRITTASLEKNYKQLEGL